MIMECRSIGESTEVRSTDARPADSRASPVQSRPQAVMEISARLSADEREIYISLRNSLRSTLHRAYIQLESRNLV